MKKTRNIMILVLLTALANAQEIKKVYTRDLIPIAKEFGVDSALNVAGGLPIYKIDSIVALELLDYISDITFPSQSEYFFRPMAHNWLIEPIKRRTKDFVIKKLNLMLSDNVDSKGKIHSIDDRLIVSLIKQKPDSIDDQIMTCYIHCNELANEYKKIFPSALTRFFKSFKYGTDPTVETFENLQLNCYELMWTLEKLDSKYFDAQKLKYHNSLLRKWQQNRDILKYEEIYRENEIQITNLDRQYNSLDEIDFTNEPNLKKLLSSFNNNEKCWKYMLINGKSGFLVLGCLYGPLAGHGETYKLELVGKTKIKITMTTVWIS